MANRSTRPTAARPYNAPGSVPLSATSTMTDWPLPRGYRFAGVVTKLRSEPDRRDVAVIIADEPSAAAGVFTQNRVCAAPVQVSRQRVPSANARAIVICSGNANACTGEQGMRDAERMTEIVANELGCLPGQVLVASTGVIGRPLPMPILEAGIPKAVHAATATREGLIDAAHAILTTDTRIKVAVHELKLSRATFTIAGFAKGAAMIGRTWRPCSGSCSPTHRCRRPT